MRTLVVAFIIILTAEMEVTVASENFTGATQYEAAAEAARERSAVFWTGNDLPRWSSRTHMVIKHTGENSSGGGGTSFTITNGQVSGFHMDIEGSPTKLVRDVIPHEVDHAVRHTLTGRYITRWVDEGSAGLMESPEHRAEMKKRAMAHVGHGCSVWKMFDSDEYPQDASHAMAFYDQAYTIVAYLIEKEGPAKMLAFQKDSRRPSDKIKLMYGMSQGELRQAWGTWMLKSGTITPRGPPTRYVAQASRKGKPHLRVFTMAGCPPCAVFKADYKAGHFNRYDVEIIDVGTKAGNKLYWDTVAAIKQAGGSAPEGVPAFHLAGRSSLIVGYDRKSVLKTLSDWLMANLNVIPKIIGSIVDRGVKSSPAPPRMDGTPYSPTVTPSNETPFTAPQVDEDSIVDKVIVGLAPVLSDAAKAAVDDGDDETTSTKEAVTNTVTTLFAAWAAKKGGETPDAPEEEHEVPVTEMIMAAIAGAFSRKIRNRGGA